MLDGLFGPAIGSDFKPGESLHGIAWNAFAAHIHNAEPILGGIETLFCRAPAPMDGLRNIFGCTLPV